MLAMVVDAHSRIATGLVAVGRSPESRDPAELTASIAKLHEKKHHGGVGVLGDASPVADVVGSLPQYGHLSVTSPGAAAGSCAMHARFGRLPWADVVAPAENLARSGSVHSQNHSSHLLKHRMFHVSPPANI